MSLRNLVIRVVKNLLTTLSRMNQTVHHRVAATTVQDSREEVIQTNKCINNLNTSNLKFNHLNARQITQ